MKRLRLGQSTAEYFILMAVIVAAVVAVGFLPKIKAAFQGYFDNASNKIVNK
jgi:Flp pilus assembly pilin Flp